MKPRYILLAAGLLAATIGGTAAMGQELEGIVVHGSRAIVTKPGNRTDVLPITAVQLSYQVDYSDLDLTTQAGTVALEQRVHDAAKAACEELGKLYPFSTPDDFECTRVTVKRAEPKLREVLAQAGKQ